MRVAKPIDVVKYVSESFRETPPKSKAPLTPRKKGTVVLCTVGAEIRRQRAPGRTNLLRSLQQSCGYAHPPVSAEQIFRCRHVHALFF